MAAPSVHGRLSSHARYLHNSIAGSPRPKHMPALRWNPCRPHTSCTQAHRRQAGAKVQPYPEEPYSEPSLKPCRPQMSCTQAHRRQAGGRRCNPTLSNPSLSSHDPPMS